MPLTTSGPPLAEFLRDLSIAWKNLMAYPEGHPARAGAVERAHQRLLNVVAPTGHLTLGVSRDALIVEETRLEWPMARKLAESLYRRGVAFVRFEEGIEAQELDAFLKRLSPGPLQEEALPLWEDLAQAGVRHIHVEPVDYSGVVMTEEATGPASQPSPSLWDDIVRELMAGRRFSPSGREIRSERLRSAAEIGSLLWEFLEEGERSAGGEPGGDEGSAARGSSSEARAVSQRLARVVGQRLAQARGSAQMEAVLQVVEILKALPQILRKMVLDAALRALASGQGTAQALETFASRLPPPMVLAGLRHLAEEGVPLPQPAVELLEALTDAAGTAPTGGPEVQVAPADMLAQLRILFQDQDVDRVPVPGDPSTPPARVLEWPPAEPGPAELAPDLARRLETITEEFVARQLSQALVELLARRPPAELVGAILGRLEEGHRLLLTRGQLLQATNLVEALHGLLRDPATDQELEKMLRRSLERLASRETVGALIERLPELPEPSLAALRRHVELLGSPAVRHLLWVLSEEDDRSRRRHLLDLLASLGPMVVRDATALLSDTRWYVVRNMILLLRNVGDRSSLPEVRRYATHPDLRVRLEAIKSLFAFEAHPPRDLLERAIFDPDPKLAEAAVTLSGSYGIAEAVAPLIALLRRWDLFGRRRSLRLSALKALGKLADPRALPRLQGFFRDWSWPPVSREERRTAFATLDAYPPEARQPLVQRGLRSRDPEIRTLCKRLASLPGTTGAPAEEAQIP